MKHPEGKTPLMLSPSEFRKGSEKFSAEISELKSHPDWIIKTYKPELLSYDKPKFKNRQEFQNYFSNIRNILNEHFSEYLPENHVIILPAGKPDDPIKGLEANIFMKKVTEIRSKSPKQTEQFYEELDEFVARAGKMFQETYDKESETGTMPDIIGHNFIYGNIGNGNARTYFIDLYPLLQVPAKGSSKNNRPDAVFNMSFAIDDYRHKYSFPYTREQQKIIMGKY